MIWTVKQLRDLLATYDDTQHVQVQRQNQHGDYEQLVICDVFESLGWHGHEDIVRIGVHHENGDWERPLRN